MASNLLDTIRARLNAPQAPSVEPQQAAIQSALKVGTTGKAIQSNIPQASNVGEQVAQRQQDLGIQQIAQQGQIQSKQLEARQLDQEQQAKIQKSELEDRRTSVKSQMDSKAQDIMLELSRGHQTMDVAKRQSSMEQAAFLLRLGNDKYLESLAQAGAKNRLDNEVNFKEQLARDVFFGGEGLSGTQAFLESIYGKDGTARVLDKDERKFNDEIAAMSLEEALQISKDASKQASTQAQVQGAVGVIGAGTQALSAYQTSQTADKGAYREYARDEAKAGRVPIEYSEFQTDKPEGY